MQEQKIRKQQEASKQVTAPVPAQVIIKPAII